jgi:putative sigma-54 modulation protein
MKVNIQSIHFNANHKLLDFISKKVEKINTFYGEIDSIMVYLRLEKDEHKDNKTMEIKLIVGGKEVFAKENSNTFETAVDLVIDKIITQVKRQKEKIQEKSQ